MAALHHPVAAALVGAVAVGIVLAVRRRRATSHTTTSNVHEVARLPIRESDAAAYARDGVVVLRGAVSLEEVESLREVLERSRASRGAFAGRMGEKGGWTDKFLWRTEAAVRAVALRSRLAEAVAQLMRTRATNLLYDHVCVKEPGDTAPTLWHRERRSCMARARVPTSRDLARPFATSHGPARAHALTRQ